MEVVHVDAGAHDFHELGERVAAFGPPRLVRRQVAGNNVWAKIFTYCSNVKPWRKGWAKIRASSQISGWVGFLPLAEVRVETRSEIEVRRTAGGVTKVAIVRGVYQIAAQPHKALVLSDQVERNRRY